MFIQDIRVPGFARGFLAPGHGSLHVAQPYDFRMTIERDKEFCAGCHRRSDISEIDATGGFERHHEQDEELLVTLMGALNCVDCHNPHKSMINSTHPTRLL